MNTGWEKINQLFHEALDRSNDSRAEFIARAAEDDPELRHELQSLLNAHDENNSFLEMPVLGANLSPQLNLWQTRILQATAPSVSNQMIGRLLDGKYLLEELCGRGGMGAVYRAMHVGTGRRVAVKVIAPELAGNREFIERFRREAKTIGRLRHPNIVNVTDFGIIGEGEQPLAYLVMEYLEGGTLAAKLKDKRPLPLADALDILRQTCAAIDEAHRLGVLHRDLKPENIWLEPVGTSGCNVKVLDFGIAQLQGIVAPDKPEDEPETPPVNSETNLSFAPQLQPYSITEDETLRLNLTLQQLTRSGTLMGSPKYMSPEQCRGEKLDEASDIYSLGVITYQMLGGELPFTGTVAELLQLHCEAEPIPLSHKRRNLPSSLDTVIGQALSKEPAARPATAGAFAFLLKLQPTGNDWLREQADVLIRQRRFKLTELAVRLQWRSWLVIGLILLATLRMPGLPSVQLVLVSGLLWLLITANVLWKQNSVTGAFTLFLEKERTNGKEEVNTRQILDDIRRRSGDLGRATLAELSGLVRHLRSFKLTGIGHWADSQLIVPPLVGEGLSVDEASQKSAKLIEPLRRKMAYPSIRRWMALALVLTTWQVMLVILGNTVDGGRRELDEAVMIRLPILLALCVTAFNLSLKSSLEQAVLYLTAKSALGEIKTDAAEPSFRHEIDHKTRGWWLTFKTYGLTCALFLLIGSLNFMKFPMMSMAIDSGKIYTVKSLQAAGVPLPFSSTADTTPFGIQRMLQREGFPIRDYSFKPYGPGIIWSRTMTEFLFQKGVDVNSRIALDGRWTPPRIGRVVMTPLHFALTKDDVYLARSFIAHGADIHAMDSIGRSPLMVAITYCPSAIGMLLDSGADRNEVSRFGPSLLAAARYQWLYHSQKRADESENAVRILLENGVDPNTRDQDGRNALMVMSMEHRTEVNISKIGPEEVVSIPSPINGLKDSVKGGPKIHIGTLEMELDPAHDAALQLICETLIRAGCDINAADINGRTPLMYALRYNHSTAVRLLLLNGADVNARDKQGMTALELAKQTENKRIIGWLQHAGSAR